jgi:acetyl esterase/lipase
MPRLFLSALPLLALPTLVSANPLIEVWPEGKMPGKAATEAEALVPRKDGFTRITNISHPTLELYPAKGVEGKAAPAVIVCPGGGYRYVVVDKEGSAIAKWLNAAGLTAFVLKYRTPDNREGALQDVQRAIRVVRARAAEFSIDPAKIGLIGFSAGGHVSARASTCFDEPAYPAIDAIDGQSARPDFAMLIYPAYLDDGKGSVSPDLKLSATIPPTLLVHTDDDKSYVTGSRVYAAALTEAKVEHRLLLYPTGGHGYGLNCNGDAKVWPEQAREWLQSVKVIPTDP